METPASTVQRLYAAFGRGDIATILASLHPAVDWRVNVEPGAPGAAAIPTFKPCRSPGDVGAFFAALAQTADIHAFQPVSILGNDREAAARGFIEFTARATGRRLKMEFMHHFAFDAQGRLTRFVDFFDTLGEAWAMGVIKAAP